LSQKIPKNQCDYTSLMTPQFIAKGTT